MDTEYDADLIVERMAYSVIDKMIKQIEETIKSE
jgi:hypothetical protein